MRIWKIIRLIQTLKARFLPSFFPHSNSPLNFNIPLKFIIKTGLEPAEFGSVTLLLLCHCFSVSLQAHVQLSAFRTSAKGH